MNRLALLKRINELMPSAGIKSEHALSVKAGLGRDYIRQIRLGNNTSPGADKLQKIAEVLGVPLDDLMAAAQDKPLTRVGDAMVAVDRVEVVGKVEAGSWRDAVEWSGQERRRLFLPADTRYPEMPRFGLMLAGDSMNLLYPLPNTIVLCIGVHDLGREPRPSEVVVVQRRRHDLVEATCKVYAPRDEEIWLEPRSSNEAHKPIRFIRSKKELAKVVREKILAGIDAEAFPDHPKNFDSLGITAIVTGAYVEQ